MNVRALPAVLMLLTAACATAAPGPRVANNPCEDAGYLALKAQPVDSLSAREYETLREQDAACAEVTRLLAASASAERPRPPARLETDAYTRAMSNDQGSEVFVRNLSTVPIIVTEVRLESCVNVSDPCVTRFPRTRINPGDTRAVLRVRYQRSAGPGSFQFRYRVEPADPAAP